MFKLFRGEPTGIFISGATGMGRRGLKAILRFDLPEERDEHRLALNGGRYFAALWEFHQKLHSMEKYDSPFPETNALALFHDIQKIWTEATAAIDWDEIS